jgi:hypothetical protein
MVSGAGVGRGQPRVRSLSAGVISCAGLRSPENCSADDSSLWHSTLPELVALIAGQLVAGRGDNSAQAISESIEAAVRIVDAAAGHWESEGTCGPRALEHFP